MKYDNLSESVNWKRISETDTDGVFELEGLYRGYGLTLGTSLRRVLLSSLPGAAITQIKIKGVNHEFSTVPGAMEDVVSMCLNLKQIRFKIHTDEPQVITLKVKGERTVTAADIESNSDVEVISPELVIATLTEKNAELDMELTVERGLGYVPSEARKLEKLPVGVIALDAIFTPVTKVYYAIEDMRVGDRTDYNRVRFTIQTDGSITPSQALRRAGEILEEHYKKALTLDIQGVSIGKESEEKKKAPKKKASKK